MDVVNSHRFWVERDSRQDATNPFILDQVPDEPMVFLVKGFPLCISPGVCPGEGVQEKRFPKTAHRSTLGGNMRMYASTA